MPAYSEEQLVAMICENDKKAFDHLYHNYAGAISFVISKIITDKHIAEDVLQEVFVNIWTNVRQYNPAKGRLYTWMRRIAVNKCKDVLRSGMHKMKQRITADETGINVFRFYAEQKTDHIGLSRQIFNLQAAQQKIVLMSFYHGHTIEEISNALDLPIGTVKSRMRRALGNIRSNFNYIA